MADRTATDVIRGFYSQIALCTLRWLTASPTATVVTEGNEDIDVEMLTSLAVTARREENIKDLADRVSARSAAVFEAIAHFASNFLARRGAGTKTTFVFTTTAGLAKQHLKSSTQALKLDILDAWLKVQKGDKGLTDALGEEITALLLTYVAKDRGRSRQFRRATVDALRGIRRQALWHEFLCCVEWNFDAPSVDETMAEVVEVVRKHPTSVTPWGIVGRISAPFVASELFLFVLRCSTRPDIQERSLTRALLDDQVRESVSRCMGLGTGLKGVHLITWVNWERQVMYAAPSHSGKTVVALFVSESDTIKDDLGRRLAKLKESSFVSSKSKQLLLAGDFFSAALESEQVGSELCNLLLNSSGDFFVGLVPGSRSPQETLREVARARVKSSRLEVVTAAALDPAWLQGTGLPVTLIQRSESVGLLAQFLADVFEHAFSGSTPSPPAHELYARMRLVIDQDGKAHRQGSPLLVRLFEEH